MKLLTGLLLCFLLLAPGVAGAAGKTVQVGETSIILPQMDGFQELYGKSPDFDKIVEHFVPPGNKLLAVYLSDADVAAMNADPQAGMKKYILVQTTAKDMTVKTPADFNAVKEDFANQIGSGSWQDDKSVNEALDQASDYMRNQFAAHAKLKIGDTKYLGKIADTADALSVMMLTNYGVATGEGEQSYPVVAGLSTLKLKSKVIVVFVYSGYEGSGDVDFVTQNTRQFIAKATGLNNVEPASANTDTAAAVPMPSPDEKVEDKPADTDTDAGADKKKTPPDADINGAMFWATKWAVLIALLAVVALLAPKVAKAISKKDERV